jgi:hypothetical protein
MSEPKDDLAALTPTAEQEAAYSNLTAISNLEWWDQLEVTDTTYTKKMDTGAKLTSINPEYQIKKFTELFGPCGRGWGFTVTHSEIIEGAVMSKREIVDADGAPINFGPCKVHTARVELWYESPEGEAGKHTIEGTGHTPFVYMTSHGPTTDMEYEKKSITDALTKAMSMLGMGGDVRMGLFDDSEYVADLQRTEAIEGAVDKEAEMIKQRQNYDDWLEQTAGLVRTSLGMHELEVIFKSSMVRLEKQGSAADKKKLNDAKNARARELMAEAKGQENIG